MGGSGKPKEVKNAVYKLFEGQLTERQLIQLKEKSRLGWTRLDMAHQGLLAGERGIWQMTPLARAYFEAHKDEPLEAPKEIAARASAETPEVATEAVPVTDFRAYDIPILRCLREGRLEKKSIAAKVHATLASRLLEGDVRVMAGGERVTDYRVSWALSQLKAAGDITNPTRGVWELTERGRDRLAAEEAAYDIADYQGFSQAPCPARYGDGCRTLLGIS
jgi:restriction endonuclease Mrr